MSFQNLAVKVHSQAEADLAQDIALAYGFKRSPYSWATYAGQARQGLCFIWVQANYIGNGKLTFPQSNAEVGGFQNKTIPLNELYTELALQLGEYSADPIILARTRAQQNTPTTQETTAMALKKVSIVRRTVKDNKCTDKIIHTSEPISNASDNGMLIATAAAVAPSLKDIPADELFAFVETLPEAK